MDEKNQTHDNNTKNYSKYRVAIIIEDMHLIRLSETSHSPSSKDLQTITRPYIPYLMSKNTNILNLTSNLHLHNPSQWTQTTLVERTLSKLRRPRFARHRSSLGKLRIALRFPSNQLISASEESNPCFAVANLQNNPLNCWIHICLFAQFTICILFKYVGRR